MFLGKEQVHNPAYSKFEKVYIFLFGIPIIGLRIRARNVFSFIPPNKRYQNILDAGSGTGVFSFELARRFPDAGITGIDLLEETINVCRHISKKLDVTNVRFLHGKVENVKEKKVFDLIMCVDILEHIEDDQKVLERLYEAAAPNGVLILHVPSLYRRYPIWKKSYNFDVQTHVRRGYIFDEIREKVSRTGFSINKSGYTYGFWETLANNISYMITRARMQNKILYSLVFPFLNILALLGSRARPKSLGAGIFIVATKYGGDFNQ